MKLKQYEKAEKVLQQALDHEPGKNVINYSKTCNFYCCLYFLYDPKE